jgi:hypothetical protein
MEVIVDKVPLVLFVAIGAMAVNSGIGLLMAFPVMWCWNYVIVHIWHLPTITWGHAWCLCFLSSTLIKSTLSAKS